MTALNASFNFGSEKTQLNYSGTKFLALKVREVFPELKINIVIIDNVHGVELTFSKKSWVKILDNIDKILKYFATNKERRIFRNEEIEVSMQKKHENMTIALIGNGGEIMNLRENTLDFLIGKKHFISINYAKLCNKVINRARRMKQLANSRATSDKFCKNFVSDLICHLDRLSSIDIMI